MNDIIFQSNYNPVRPDVGVSDAIKGVKVERIKSPVYSFFAPTNTLKYTQYQDHEYNLYEYGRMIDTESIISVAFRKKRTLMFKGGYSIESENEKNSEYMISRLKEIQYVTGITFDELIRETAYNLVAYHNAYLIKVRKKDASTAKGRLSPKGKEMDPIAGYFNLPPEMVQVKLDSYGNPIRYRQYLSPNRYREYNPDDIIHIHYGKRTGLKMGVPPLESVKDDVLALRRIEESIETLIYKSLFPILHLKVGNEKAPARKYPDGTSEVGEATRHLRTIEDNGGIVTSERVEIKAIGAESLALRVESYLAHFKGRVFIGLGMSGVDFGEGDATGRATGEVLSESLKESVMDYQQALSVAITHKIFDDLLVDSGKFKAEYLIKDEDRVEFKFESLDMNTVIKVESHALNQFTQGVTDINETRKKLGYKPKNDQEINKMRVQKNGPDPVPGAPGGSKSSSGSTKSKPAAKASSSAKKSGNLTKNIAKPKNQHTSTKDDLTSLIISILDSSQGVEGYDRIANLLNCHLNDLCLVSKLEISDADKSKLVYNFIDNLYSVLDSTKYQELSHLIDTKLLELYISLS